MPPKRLSSDNFASPVSFTLPLPISTFHLVPRSPSPAPPSPSPLSSASLSKQLQPLRPSSGLFIGTSEVSTGYSCNSCKKGINKVEWFQCQKCNIFDLCNDCVPIKYAAGSSKSERVDRPHVDAVILSHIDPDSEVHCTEGGEIEDIIPVSFDVLKQGPIETSRRDRCGYLLDVVDWEGYPTVHPIQNDRDLWIVMVAQQDPNIHRDPAHILDGPNGKHVGWRSWEHRAAFAVYQYHLDAAKRTKRILSLDGGGIRGYMTIKVVMAIIEERQRAHPEITFDQTAFASTIDYFVGTSTGGLISYCLAVDFPLEEMQQIYTQGTRFFKKQGAFRWGIGSWRLPALNSAKYDPTPIHDKIDEILEWTWRHHQGQPPPPRGARETPQNYQDRLDAHQKFVGMKFNRDTFTIGQLNRYILAPRGRVLVINAYDCTAAVSRMFNSHYANHAPLLVHDILKSTMAAPTYFPIYLMSMPEDDSLHNTDNEHIHAMADGGLFANDPELTGLWVSRMDTQTLNTYRLLAIGTGCFTTKVDTTMRGGILGWLSKGGLLINTLMEANKSFTESISAQMARFSNIRRYKLSCDLSMSMELDDVTFPAKFDDEWNGVHGRAFKKSIDMKALHFFYTHFFLDEEILQEVHPGTTNEQAHSTIAKGQSGFDSFKGGPAVGSGVGVKEKIHADAGKEDSVLWHNSD